VDPPLNLEQENRQEDQEMQDDAPAVLPAPGVAFEQRRRHEWRRRQRPRGARPHTPVINPGWVTRAGRATRLPARFRLE